MKTLIISDQHLGVQRVAGTTQASAQALREYLHDHFEICLRLADDVIINGDLFDSNRVATADLLKTYETLSDWLTTGERAITLIAGNHDLSKNSQELSSFELLAFLLRSRYPGQVEYLQGAGIVRDGIYAISHVVNNEIFDLELSRVPEGVKFLCLHANFDSKFAADAEHSLNLDRAQAKALTARGIKIVMGHEHQGRELMNGKVLIVGNQAPGSVSDCLGNDTKRALLINGDSHEFVQTWSAEDEGDGWFAKIDWRELAGVEEEGRGFIRVEGEATADEAADVVRAISTFRSKSKSFVVANAVKVEALEGMDELAESIEDIRSLDVIEMLLAELDEPQVALIRKLVALS